MLGFDWDETNIAHLARPGISTKEVEYVLSGITLMLESQDWDESEERFSEAGMTA